MRIVPRAGLYGIYEATEEGGEAAARLLAQVKARLEEQGIEVHPAPVVVVDDQTARAAARFFKAEEIDLLVSVIVTWSFDSLHVTILRRVPLPLAILAVPDIRAGSIVGAHQLGSLLADLGMQHAVFYGPEADPGTYAPLAAYAQAAAARMRLSLGKLGFIGRRTPGMTPIAFDEVQVTRQLGPLVEPYGWEEVDERARAVPEAEVADEAARVSGAAGTVDSAESAVKDSVRLALCLRRLAAERGILAYGVGCYPHFAGRACLALALLTEAGLPAGCEGDLNAGALMYLLQAFTGAPALFGEILEVNEADNTIVTSHCGCGAPSLAARRAEVTLTPVRLFHAGVCVRYPARSAPRATYANLAGRAGSYRLCAASGSASECGMVFEGNPVAFKPRVAVSGLLQTVGAGGFGHHWMLGYGDAVEPLARFCAMTGIDGVFPGSNGPAR
jgi:L-fucose isomerase-like protein